MRRIKAPRLWSVVFLTTLVFMASASGMASSFSYGLTAGLPVSSLATADDGRIAATGRYTFGPALILDLRHGFGLQLDLLYKRIDFGFTSDPARIVFHRVELAPKVRYAFRASRIPLFLQAGVSFNRVIAAGGASACADPSSGKGFYCIGGTEAVQLRHRHTHGFVLGAGLDFRRGVLRLLPEFRVTRWADRNFGTRDSSPRSNLTQVELLLGMAF